MTPPGPTVHVAHIMLHAISLALRQLLHPATLRLVLIVGLITLLLFTLVGAAGWWALDTYVVPRFAADGAGELAALALVGLFILSGWFLFRTVAVAVMGLFTDGIIASVEEDHYPQAAARARPVNFAMGLKLALASVGRAIGWNLLAAPFYLVLLFTGIGTLLLVLVVNARLLAHDCEAMVAARHADLPDRPLDRTQRWVLGLATSAMFLIPFLNLLAPVFGAALAVHLLHMPRRPSPSS